MSISSDFLSFFTPCPSHTSNDGNNTACRKVFNMTTLFALIEANSFQNCTDCLIHVKHLCSFFMSHPLCQMTCLLDTQCCLMCSSAGLTYLFVYFGPYLTFGAGRLLHCSGSGECLHRKIAVVQEARSGRVTRCGWCVAAALAGLGKTLTAEQKELRLIQSKRDIENPSIIVEAVPVICRV